MFLNLEITPHDWKEDFPHENGKYICKCHSCGVHFQGHKRRVTCKVCSTHSKGIQQQVQADSAEKPHSLT